MSRSRVHANYQRQRTSDGSEQSSSNRPTSEPYGDHYLDRYLGLDFLATGEKIGWWHDTGHLAPWLEDLRLADGTSSPGCQTAHQSTGTSPKPTTTNTPSGPNRNHDESQNGYTTPRALTGVRTWSIVSNNSKVARRTRLPNYIERAVLLLKSRYFVLSTLDAQGPWTTPLNHVVSFSDEVTLVYYSNPSSRHSLALNNDKNTSGAIYEIDSDGNADGMQFVCTVEPIPVDDLERVHKYYYENNFPNPAEREEWLIPREQFLPDGVHWFYRVRLTRAWLIDVETWDTDRVDRRVEVDLHSVVNGA